MMILFIYKKMLKEEDIHCTCITPGQDLGFALGCMSVRGLTLSDSCWFMPYPTNAQVLAMLFSILDRILWV